MRKMLVFAVIALVLGLSVAAANIGKKPGFCGTSTYGQCKTDQDCIRSGCSGEVCQSSQEEKRITSCIWKGCYDPARYGVRCVCRAGKCQWA